MVLTDGILELNMECLDGELEELWAEISIDGGIIWMKHQLYYSNGYFSASIPQMPLQQDIFIRYLMITKDYDEFLEDNNGNFYIQQAKPDSNPHTTIGVPSLSSHTTIETPSPFPSFEENQHVSPNSVFSSVFTYKKGSSLPDYNQEAKTTINFPASEQVTHIEKNEKSLNTNIRNQASPKTIKNPNNSTNITNIQASPPTLLNPIKDPNLKTADFKVKIEGKLRYSDEYMLKRKQSAKAIFSQSTENVPMHFINLFTDLGMKFDISLFGKWDNLGEKKTPLPFGYSNQFFQEIIQQSKKSAFEHEPTLWETTDGLHCMAIATFGINSTQVFGISYHEAIARLIAYGMIDFELNPPYLTLLGAYTRNFLLKVPLKHITDIALDIQDDEDYFVSGFHRVDGGPPRSKEMFGHGYTHTGDYIFSLGLEKISIAWPDDINSPISNSQNKNLNHNLLLNNKRKPRKKRSNSLFNALNPNQNSKLSPNPSPIFLQKSVTTSPNARTHKPLASTNTLRPIQDPNKVRKSSTYSSGGNQNYHGVSLLDSHRKFLENIERKIREPIPVADKITYGTFGYMHESHQITHLCLGRKRLKSLPDDIGELKSLVYLNLHDNVLSRLPESISELNRLDYLFLKTNQLHVLPKSFGNLTSLKTLSLRENYIDRYPDNMDNLTSLTFLDISANYLTYFPDWICNLPNLNKLSIGNNKIVSVPDKIENLSNLREFWSNLNPITRLPKQIGKLSKLEIFSMADNQLESLPEKFGCLRSLLHLNVKNNVLSTLPSTMGDLLSLQELNLEKNNFTTLPEELAKLKQVKDLNTSENPFSSFSRNIKTWLIAIIEKGGFVNTDGKIKYQPNTFKPLAKEDRLDDLMRWLKDY